MKRAHCSPILHLREALCSMFLLGLLICLLSLRNYLLYSLRVCSMFLCILMAIKMELHVNEIVEMDHR